MSHDTVDYAYELRITLPTATNYGRACELSELIDEALKLALNNIHGVIVHSVVYTY